MKRFRVSFPISAIAVASIASLDPCRAQAQWTVNGAIVCNMPNNQGSQAVVSDGSGGAIVCWVDTRTDAGDVYAQRISAAGVALWSAGGVIICSAANEQHSPVIASDGAGGAIIAWADERVDALSDDIYAQHIGATGLTQWEPNGAAICVATNTQYEPVVTTDAGGGAIIAWVDERISPTSDDIYAQRIGSSGFLAWQSNGISLCAAANNQGNVRLASDGFGGAIAAWTDLRNGNNLDIYSQRVSDSGAVLWTLNGVAVCSVNRDQRRPTIATDGAGGAIIAWIDWRFEFESDVYAQRINALGSSQWPVGGVALCGTFEDQGNAEIASDDCGGAIVAWHDWGGNGLDIVAQRVNSAGSPLWPVNGVFVCNGTGTQFLPTIVSDGACGAIITWEDQSQGIHDADVYAGRINSSGTVLWGSTGVSISAAANNQSRPVVATDKSGGAVIAWADERNGTSNLDIFAHRIGPAGTIPTAVRTSSGSLPLAVSPNMPNPFSSATVIDVHLNRESDVDVKVYDVTGRLVRNLERRRLSAGTHRVRFDGRDDSGRSLPSGVYFFKVAGTGSHVTRKIVLER